MTQVADDPRFRQYCQVLMRCPTCGTQEYRRPMFVPANPPLYKGHEERIPEWCDAHWTGGEYTSACHSMMEIVPGFNHDLTLHTFDVDMETITDGRVKGHRRVSSLHEVRKIESESLQRHANGEGQPMVFRDLSQDASNRDVHTLRNTTYERGRAMPKEEMERRAKTHAGAITAERVATPDGH